MNIQQDDSDLLPACNVVGTFLPMRNGEGMWVSENPLQFQRHVISDGQVQQVLN